MTQVEYVRTKNALFSKLGGEVVALNIERGHCYGFNDTASAIWEMLETPQSIRAICAIVATRFEVDTKECKAEIEQLLHQLVEEGLVSQSGTGVRDD